MNAVVAPPLADHHKALSKAKIQLMAKENSAFFSALCFSLKQVFDENIPTACAGGTTIRFNPRFFMSLTPAEQVFLLLHETMHIAYLHSLRFQPGMNHDRANIAMDHVINLQLIEAGFTMPKGGHADPKYKGMCWEEVYKLLPEEAGKPQMQDVKPGAGDPSDAEGAGTKSADDLTREIQDILVRASIQSKVSGDAPGSIPGDIQIFLNGLLNPKLPWQRILQKYLNQFCKNDYTFKRPNRRFFPKYHLPSLWGEKLMDLAIAVDISGSVSDADFHVFVSEIASIFRMMKPNKITLIQFDTAIHGIDEVRNLQELMKVKFTGRGGTAIEPVLEWANVNKPELLMVFSDGEFRFHGTETKSTTLWMIHNNEKFKPPFGKVINYTI